MSISLIWASANGVIGKDNDIPWMGKLPSDMKYFKKTTLNHYVVMGRRTFESMGSKPLTDRINIVITSRNVGLSHSKDNTTVVFANNFAEILKNARIMEEEVFIIGGLEIFKQCFGYADRLYITEIDAEFEGDTFFNPNLSNFQLISSEDGLYNEENIYPHKFLVYERKNG